MCYLTTKINHFLLELEYNSLRPFLITRRRPHLCVNPCSPGHCLCFHHCRRPHCCHMDRLYTSETFSVHKDDDLIIHNNDPMTSYHNILNTWLFWWKHSRQSWWSLELSSSPSLLSPTRKSEVMSSWWDILVGMDMRGDTGDIGLVTILWHWWHCCLFLSNCKPLVPRLTSSSWPQPQ